MSLNFESRHGDTGRGPLFGGFISGLLVRIPGLLGGIGDRLYLPILVGGRGRLGLRCGQTLTIWWAAAASSTRAVGISSIGRYESTSRTNAVSSKIIPNKIASGNRVAGHKNGSRSGIADEVGYHRDCAHDGSRPLHLSNNRTLGISAAYVVVDRKSSDFMSTTG